MGELLSLAWRYSEAEDVFLKALAQRGDASAFVPYARHLLSTGRPHQAVSLLRTAIISMPYDVPLRMLLIRAQLQAHEPQSAIAELQAAASEHPDHQFLQAFALAVQATVLPTRELADAARRLIAASDGAPHTKTVGSYVLARTDSCEEALQIAAAALQQAAANGKAAALYAATLGAAGRLTEVGGVLDDALRKRCGTLGMVIHDPANAWIATDSHWSAIRASRFRLS